MISTSLVQAAYPSKGNSDSIRHRGLWQFAAGAVLLGSGIAAGIIGLPCLSGSWLWGDRPGSFTLHGIGSAMVLATMPLMTVGAALLDWAAAIDRRDQRQRNRRRREQS